MLTRAEGKACYLHIVNKIETVEKTDEYKEALSLCNRSMVNWMLNAYPLIIRAYMEAIGDYGFPKNSTGIRHFEKEMSELRRGDSELVILGEKVRNKIIPCMRTPLPNANSVMQ